MAETVWSVKLKQLFKNIQNHCSKNAIKCAAIISGFGLFSGVAIAQTIWQQPIKQANSIQNKAYFPVENCINMASGLNAPHEGDWSYTFDESHFAAIKAAGFDSVRIPIRWSLHISPNPPHTIDPKFLARVDQIISFGLKYDLAVIIDVHNFDELYKDPDTYEPVLMAIWEQLSYHYAKAPPKLIFEIINEPQDKFSGARVNKAQNEALKIIRKYNPTRTTILAGDEWGAIDGMDNLKPPQDPYIVATVHYYGPFEFTHQGAEWMGKDAPPKGRNWPLKGEFDQLNKDITRMYEWREKLNIPVFMGEYGTDLAVPEHLRISWAYYTTKGFKAAKIPTCYFNFASGFGIYDTQNKKWNEPHLKAIGLK